MLRPQTLPLFGTRTPYIDTFDSNAGIDIVTTAGDFNNVALRQVAQRENATLVSACISLPQPAASIFTAWSFADANVVMGSATAATLRVETCAGVELLTTPITESGCVDLDISAIPAVENVRLAINAVHPGAPGTGGVQGLEVSRWSVFGISSGGATVIPNTSPQIVDAGNTVEVGIQVSSSGGALRNPVIDLSLDRINDLGDAIDAGLFEDAEEDYGSGLTTFHPLEFASASLGPLGEAPATPAPGGTTGSVSWPLSDLPD